MIFIDTSAFIALIFSKDDFYLKALNFWKESSKEVFVTSNFVIMESLGWIRYKLGQKKAIEVGDRFYQSGDIQIEKITDSDEKYAWRLVKNLKGDGVSMVDCTSFAVMKRKGIKKVFTFDQDFKKAGFTVLPKFKSN